MQSISRGWSFFTQAWKMAMDDKDLLKPSIYALVVGIIVSLICMVPMGILTFLFYDSGRVGQVIIGIAGALFLFIQYAVTYIFSAMTVHLIYQYLTDGDGQMDRAWAIVQRDWLDILSLAAASTVVDTIQNLVRGNGRDRNPLRTLIADLIKNLWTEATYLVLPIMVIEDLSLPAGLKRATGIVKNNLLLIGVSMVGVGFITGLIGFVFAVLGIGLGVAVGLGVISMAGESATLVVMGVILGFIIATPFFMVASVVNSYTSTAYHTCLFIWARSVENAPNPSQVAAPAPLAAALQA